MGQIVIEAIHPNEFASASVVAGRAYLTNPLNIAAFGKNLRRNEGMMRVAIERLPGLTFVAKDNNQIIGLMKMVESPDCQVPPVKMLPLIPIMLMTLGGSFLNVLKWLPVWGKHDPNEHHWHFGPFAVLPERQHQGIGSQLLSYFCSQVDQKNAAAYLETDRQENVRLYQHFGFTLTSEANVLGVPNWFMWREPIRKA